MEKRVITYLMLIVALALVMASCSEHDDFVDTNPLHDDIVGSFYKLYDVNGSIDGVISKTSLPHEYTRIVEVYHFGEDGTEFWNRYFFDDESGEPFADLGGGQRRSRTIQILNASRWLYQRHTRQCRCCAGCLSLHPA